MPLFRFSHRRIASVSVALACFAVATAFACSPPLFFRASIDPDVLPAEPSSIVLRYAPNAAVGEVIEETGSGYFLRVTESLRGSIRVGAKIPFQTACDSCGGGCYSVGERVAFVSDDPSPDAFVYSAAREDAYGMPTIFWHADDESTGAFLAFPDISARPVAVSTLAADTERVRASLSRALVREGFLEISCVAETCSPDRLDEILSEVDRMDISLRAKLGKIRSVRHLSSRQEAILDIAERTIARQRQALDATRKRIGEMRALSR